MSDFQRLSALRAAIADWYAVYAMGYAAPDTRLADLVRERQAVRHRLAVQSVTGCRVRTPGGGAQLRVIAGGRVGD